MVFIYYGMIHQIHIVEFRGGTNKYDGHSGVTEGLFFFFFFFFWGGGGGADLRLRS